MHTQAIETGYLHPTLNQHNLVDEVQGMDTCAGGKVKHEVSAIKQLETCDAR